MTLWNAVRDGDHEAALKLHDPLLRLWNAIAGDNLPACVKYALEIQGLESGHPRAPMPPASPGRKRAIAAALKKLA